MNIDNEHVLTCEGVVMWDGITQPDTNDAGAVVHSLKIGIAGTSPERAELEALANRTLAASEFKGVLPPGGEWPVREIDMAKYADDAAIMTGRIALNANTRLGAPQVFDVNGQVLSSMQYGQMLYPGATVKMLVHCYPFNKKSKGVAYGLDGIQIIDATTPKLSVSGGMAQAAVAAAFAGGGAATPPAHVAANGAAVTQPPALANAATTTPPPNTEFVENAGAVAHVMLAAANGQTYEQLTAAGWTDAQLIQHGYMQA